MTGLGYTEDYITYYPFGRTIWPTVTQIQIGAHASPSQIITPVRTYIINGTPHRIRIKIEVSSTRHERTGNSIEGTCIRRMHMTPTSVITVPNSEGPVWNVEKGEYQPGKSDSRAGTKDQSTQTEYWYPDRESWEYRYGGNG